MLMNKAPWSLFIFFFLLVGCGPGDTISPAAKTGSADRSKACHVSTLAEALDRAVEKKKYIVALVFENGKKDNLGSVFENVKRVIPERAVYTEVDVEISEEQDLINKYELKDTPRPFLLLVTCHGDAISWLPEKNTKVGDVTFRLASDIVPELVRAIEDKPLVMLLIGPSNSDATGNAREAANSYGASIGEEFKLFFVDNGDEKEAFLIRGAGLSPKSQKPAIVVYYNKKYKGRLTAELTVEKIKEIVHGLGCS